MRPRDGGRFRLDGLPSRADGGARYRQGGDQRAGVRLVDEHLDAWPLLHGEFCITVWPSCAAPKLRHGPHGAVAVRVTDHLKHAVPGLVRGRRVLAEHDGGTTGMPAALAVPAGRRGGGVDGSLTGAQRRVPD